MLGTFKPIRVYVTGKVGTAPPKPPFQQPEQKEFFHSSEGGLPSCSDWNSTNDLWAALAPPPAYPVPQTPISRILIYGNNKLHPGLRSICQLLDML